MPFVTSLVKTVYSAVAKSIDKTVFSTSSHLSIGQLILVSLKLLKVAAIKNQWHQWTYFKINSFLLIWKLSFAIFINVGQHVNKTCDIVYNVQRESLWKWRHILPRMNNFGKLQVNHIQKNSSKALSQRNFGLFFRFLQFYPKLLPSRHLLIQKMKYKNVRSLSKACSKFTIKTPEQCQICRLKKTVFRQNVVTIL